MKIGILGGSFDPPHIGHLELSRQLLKHKLLDEVWFMPCNKHNFNKQMSSVEDRLNIIKMVAEKGIKVSEIEIQRGGVSYTIETLDELRHMYPHNRFFWIMGSDQVPFFPKYKSWQEILARHSLIVFPREDNVNAIVENIKKCWNLQDVLPSIIILDSKEFKINNVSSTEIRERVKKRESIVGLVTQDVEKYIKEKKLYK